MRQAISGTNPSRHILLVTSVAALGLLAGCQSGADGGSATRAAAPGGKVQLLERDVEAPEIFEAREAALWDGRPSLGGVWVASPEVTAPERIVIRNADNGKSIVGALFKRERLGPGPALQLSSDAAIALGILAGAPTTIDVVALRRREPEAEVAAAPADAPQPVAQLDSAPPAGAPVDTSDAPSEAIAAAATDALAETAPQQAALDPAEAADPAPRRGGFFGRIFGKRGASAATVDAAASEPLAAGAAAPDITATSLDAAPAAAPPAVPAATAAPVIAAAPVPDAPASGPVQVGTFTTEAEAQDAANRVATAGLTPTILKTGGRKPSWRILVSPGAAAPDQAAVLRTALDLGFEGAFATDG